MINPLPMCIALLALASHSEFPLIVLANRDEFLARPTLAMHEWKGAASIVAGKDLVGGEPGSESPGTAAARC